MNIALNSCHDRVRNTQTTDAGSERICRPSLTKKVTRLPSGGIHVQAPPQYPGFESASFVHGIATMRAVDIVTLSIIPCHFRELKLSL